jgi:hypothetical protein
MLNFQDLPDELILKILSYQEAKDLISCGQASKRIRRISHDGTLWVTTNLEKKIVKTELLEMILRKGCSILNLCNCTILGSLSLNIKSQLRVLKLSQFSIHDDCDTDCKGECVENTGFFDELLFSCCSLQHLVMERVFLTPKIAKSICKNGKTLQTLNLNYSDLDSDSNNYWQEIIQCCLGLKEVNLACTNYGEGITAEDLKFLAENIPPDVEKLSLSCTQQDRTFNDYHVKTLLRRCNKIKTLSLESTCVTHHSLTNIRQCLNHTLEELSLGPCDKISLTGFLELKSMPRLKILNVYFCKDEDEEIQILRRNLPHLMIKKVLMSKRGWHRFLDQSWLKFTWTT